MLDLNSRTSAIESIIDCAVAVRCMRYGEYEGLEKRYKHVLERYRCVSIYSQMRMLTESAAVTCEIVR